MSFRGGLGTFGRSEVNFCNDRQEWVEVGEVCVHCDKYGEWDGKNFDCKDHFDWEQQVDENIRAAELAELEEDPDLKAEPLTEYGEILQRWFEEEQEQEDGEEEVDEKEDLGLTPEQQAMRSQIGYTRKGDNDREDGERDEEEDDADETDDEEDEDDEEEEDEEDEDW